MNTFSIHLSRALLQWNHSGKIPVFLNGAHMVWVNSVFLRGHPPGQGENC